MYLGSKGKSELFGDGLASYEATGVIEGGTMRASGMPRRGAERCRRRARRSADLGQHIGTSKSALEAPEALTFCCWTHPGNRIGAKLHCV